MIQTERLILRPFTPGDEVAVVSLLMCADFMIHSPSGALQCDSARERFRRLMSSYEANGFGKLAVVLKPCKTLIGYCGVEMCEIDSEYHPELGFRLVSQYRGKGYATEAARAVLCALEIDNVIAFTEPSNKESVNVLQKLGFCQTGMSSFGGIEIMLFGLRK